MGIPNSSHRPRKVLNLVSATSSPMLTIRKSSRTWHMLPHPFHCTKSCRASETVSKIAQLDLELMGRVMSHNQCWNHLIPGAGMSSGSMGMSLYACAISILARKAPWPAYWMRWMAASTMSYLTVPSSAGMHELTETPSKGAERSWITLNLPGTFFFPRPSGNMT